ncbi:MAG: TetR/AcrR family transcriptional regulator [Solirubrobacteraceae bacterium]
MSLRVNRHERSQQLLDVTLALIAERGYEAISVQDIADAAGVSKPIIYRIYPSQHALLLALFRREQQRAETVLERIVPPGPDDRHPAELLLDSLRGILDAVSSNPLTWRLVLFPAEGTPEPVRALVERRRATVRRRARALVRWGLSYLSAPLPVDEDLLARILVSWAQEYARILLEDPVADRDHLLASARALLASLDWREPALTG